jgi:hypothetical protein
MDANRKWEKAEEENWPLPARNNQTAREQVQAIEGQGQIIYVQISVFLM